MVEMREGGGRKEVPFENLGPPPPPPPPPVGGTVVETDLSEVEKVLRKSLS